MPILKSSKKRARQNIVRQDRLRPYKTRYLTMIKNILKLVEDGKIDEAKKRLSETYTAIDMAMKKHILHKNTAARKKSLVQKYVTRGEKGEIKKVVKATTKKKDAGAKKVKTTKKKVEKKTEEAGAEA